MTTKRFWIILFLWLAPAALCSAQTLRIAAAANLMFVLPAIDADFAATHPGITVTPVFGSSGNLVSQIEQGAPFDVFLSADIEFPRKLIAAGGADASTLKTFAYGKLVLWSTQPDLPMPTIAAVVRNSRVTRLAIANPRTAPYGRAAREAIARLGLLEVAEPKLVTAENIAQTAQFVSSGNAEAGFVALSLVLAPNLKDRGRWLDVPADLYTSIAQAGVVTHRAAGNESARAYLEFLSSPPARSALARFGYGTP
ncbi:MAG TPA: molybdate ABC transporter substrate-binding protein [Opitutaceae bacterium]|jgi:molybdate transport system substrate-binding protein